MFLVRWLRWARRSRQVAFVMLIDILLIGLVIAGLVILLWPKSSGLVPTPAVPPTAPGLVLPAVGYDAITPSPLPPTVNPTQLAKIPNQGLSSAPLPPANLLTPGGTLGPTVKK